MTYHSNGVGAMTGEGFTEPDYSEFRANMLAANEYMMRTPVKTAKAQRLKDDWIKWYDGLDYYDYYVTCSSLPCKHWDIARMKKEAFNVANATTEKELYWVKRVAETGMSTEETMGQPKRRTSKGTYGDTPKPRPEWLPPTGYLIGGAVLGVVGLYVHFAIVRPRLRRRAAA